MYRIIFWILSLAAFKECNGDALVITNYGPIRGVTLEAQESDVEAFLGIPFAIPPVGDLRFQKPIAPAPWDDVLEANQKPPPCIQNATEKYYWMPDTENMTEDCLYLSVWVPKTANVQPKAVLVWIYGGAFQIGSSDMELYDGTLLSAYGDIIVVSFNYRVGFMGYFYTPIREASGNMGMYDQIMALEWIKENIEYFGGDPNMITLMGESAGSMSISGHLISPLTKHLFKRAIMHSGAGFHPLSFDANESQLKVGNTMAKMTGCANSTVTTITDPYTVVECLKQLPPERISEAEGILRKANPLTVFPIFGDAYLPEEITQTIKRGLYKDTDLLIGMNEEEGSFFLTVAVPEYFGVNGKDGAENLSKRLTQSLIRTMFNTVNQNNTKQIAGYYIGNQLESTTDSMRQAIYQALGDYTISCGVLFFADFYSRTNNNVHFFKFTHRSKESPTAEWVRTTHFDEVQYIFGNPLRNGTKYTDKEELLSRRILDRWINFAKTGNPDIPNELKWPSYSHDYPAYLDMGIEESIRLRPVHKRCEFWRDRFRANMDNLGLAEPLTGLRDSASILDNAKRTLILVAVIMVLFS